MNNNTLNIEEDRVILTVDKRAHNPFIVSSRLADEIKARAFQGAFRALAESAITADIEKAIARLGVAIDTTHALTPEIALSAVLCAADALRSSPTGPVCPVMIQVAQSMLKKEMTPLDSAIPRLI